jgi:hypothetical protein
VTDSAIVLNAASTEIPEVATDVGGGVMEMASVDAKNEGDEDDSGSRILSARVVVGSTAS